MMLRFVVTFCVFLALAAPGAAPLKLKSLQVGSRTYKNVTVLGANTTDIYFRHDEGIANIRLKYLNESLQRRFNYDAQAATEAERQQAEDDARYQAVLAADVAARAQQVARAAQQTAATSEHHLVDSITDKSPIGKPVPSLEASQWVGEKPDTEGKFVLRFYWAPWSVPCQQAISGLNRLQKQYADQLAVIGVTTDSAESLENLPGDKPEFASVLDPEAKAITAAGITYVPQVLLMDPNGALLFQGHPGALNSTNLSVVMVRPE